MRIIRTDKDVADGLAHLLAVDRRLIPIAERAGDVPLRLRAPGFEGLIRIVVSQQVSVASAAAIWERLCRAISPFEVATVDGLDDAALIDAGLSRPKIRTIRAVSDAVRDGLDLAGLGEKSADDAHGDLVAIRGIGPWTADVYLMFCLGHADAFAAGDLALQAAAATAFDLDRRPDADELVAIAEDWRPWRAVAARLLWAYYRACREGRDTLPI